MRTTHLTMAAAAASLAAVLATAPAGAAEDKLAKYQPTGKKESCVDTYRIRETDVIDNQHILFRTDGNTYYLNRLPHRCSGLKIQDGFSYTLRGLNKLCNVDTITPVSTGGAVYGPCPLGDFEEVVKAK
jgi:hypothetical protein